MAYSSRWPGALSGALGFCPIRGRCPFAGGIEALRRTAGAREEGAGHKVRQSPERGVEFPCPRGPGAQAIPSPDSKSRFQVPVPKSRFPSAGKRRNCEVTSRPEPGRSPAALRFAVVMLVGRCGGGCDGGRSDGAAAGCPQKSQHVNHGSNCCVEGRSAKARRHESIRRRTGKILSTPAPLPAGPRQPRRAKDVVDSIGVLLAKRVKERAWARLERQSGGLDALSESLP